MSAGQGGVFLDKVNMAAIEILEDFFFIERGYLSGNHFLYRSGDPVLIDTGYVADFADTRRYIESLGVKIPDISRIISTHCHCDHIGGNRIIQERSGCDIALHAVGKHFIETGDDWSTWWRYYHQEAEFFECTQALNDGDVIRIGPYAFQIIYTPGHASDGIVLYNAAEKILISSDTLWEDDVAVMTIRVEGSAALFRMMRSLEKIALLDVRTVYPGHGKPFGNFQQAVSKSKRRIESYMFDRERIGNDLLKKIIVYTLLMKKSVKSETFFADLMDTFWFTETVAHYFDGEYALKYAEIVNGFIRRGIIRREKDSFVTTVKP